VGERLTLDWGARVNVCPKVPSLRTSTAITTGKCDGLAESTFGTKERLSVVFSLRARPGTWEEMLRKPHIPDWNWYGTTDANSNESNPSEALKVRFAHPSAPAARDTFASVPFAVKNAYTCGGERVEERRAPEVLVRVNVWAYDPVFTRCKETESPAGTVRNCGENDGRSVRFMVTFSALWSG